METSAMNLHGLFLYGIFLSVLEEIMCTQSTDPNRTLYLQPYSGDNILMLKNNPPKIQDPIRVYFSTSEFPSFVSFTADIVGWEDKTKLTASRRGMIERDLNEYQPGEGGLYNYSKSPGRPSLNLIHICRLVKLPDPFSILNLIKISDGEPYSPNKTSPGGWSEVRLV